MINFTSRTAFYMRPEPTDMRNGRNGLAEIIRTSMGHDPYNYDEAFIFYSKDYRKIKIFIMTSTASCCMRNGSTTAAS